jgi:hypothetical protein
MAIIVLYYTKFESILTFTFFNCCLCISLIHACQILWRACIDAESRPCGRSSDATCNARRGAPHERLGKIQPRLRHLSLTQMSHCTPPIIYILPNFHTHTYKQHSRKLSRQHSYLDRNISTTDPNWLRAPYRSTTICLPSQMVSNTTPIG